MSASNKKRLRKEQNAAALTEKQQKELTEAKKLKKQTITFVVVIALIVAIGLGSLAVTAYNNSGIAERLSTALTVGDHNLSAADLGYFYYDAINAAYEDWYSMYGEYTSTYMAVFHGLDLAAPLSEQMYDKENGKTFADYFIDQAVEDAVSTYTIYDLAVNSGMTLDEADRQSIDNTIANLSVAAKAYGYNNATDYLQSIYGKGASKQSFRKYLEALIVASSLESETSNSLTYTDDDLAAYNEEHFDEFSSFSYSTFDFNPSDFLVCTADEDDKEHEHSQEEQDAALTAAKEAAESVIDAKPANVEDFNKAIKSLAPFTDSETASCTETVDSLYSSISDEEIAKWLADSSRKPGDLKLITLTNDTTDENGNTFSTPYAYTVILFQNRNDNETKLVNVRHILRAFTNGTTDENGNTVYTDESKAQDMTTIKEWEQTWLNAGGTEEAFAELATKNSDDTGSTATGGLYEDIYPGQMVPAFNDWCFDASRQSGDYEIVETEYGYHLIYFVDHSDVTFRNFMIENVMRNSDLDKWYQEQMDAAVYTVKDTSKMNKDIIISG